MQLGRPPGARALAAAVLVAVALGFWQWRVIAPVRLPQAVDGWNADLYTIYYPVLHFAYRSARLLPSWNPYQLAGTPFLANYNGGFLYPANLLARLLPVQQALGWVCALHLALAGCGALACARALGLSLPAALLAGVVFMLNGYFVVAQFQPSYFAGHAWVPLVFLAGGRLLAAPGWRTGAVLGVVLAIQFLTGHAQILCYEAYGLLVAGSAWIAARRRWDGPALLRLAGAAGVAGATAALVAAVQILPTAELLVEAARGRLSLAQTMPDRPSADLAVRALVSAGPAVVLLPAALLDRRRRPVVTSALALGGFAVLVGISSPVYGAFFYHLPGVARFRVPNRMLVLSALALAILAAIGLEAARATRPLAARRALAALLLAAGLLLIGAERALRVAPLDRWVVAVLAGAVLLPALAAPRAARAAAWGLLALVVAERFTRPGNTMMLPQHNPEAFFAAPPFARFLAAHAAADRVLVIKNWARRFPMMEKVGTLYGFATVQDYEPLAPRAYQDFLAPIDSNIDAPLFWGRFYPPAGHPRWPLLDMLATRFVVVDATQAWRPDASGRFSLVYQDDAVRLYENHRSLPRAHLVERAEVIADPGAALARVHDPRFDPRATVVVDRPVAWRPAADDPARAAEAMVTALAPEEVLLRASTPRPAILILADLHWPGWHVAVDGEERPLYRADFLFRGVALEPGAHEVRFWYAPASVRLGLALTLATLAVLAGAGAAGVRRRVHPPAPGAFPPPDLQSTPGKENGMERVELTREVAAVQIPVGDALTLEKGSVVFITQSLGGSYTVQVPAYGGLFRIDGGDADALGKSPTAAPEAPAEGGDLEQQVWEVLRTCYDPEIPVNIVDLGLVYDLRVTPEPDGRSRVDVKMTLTAPGCGMGVSIAADARRKFLALPGVADADVEIVWDPPWTPQMISPEGRERLGIA